MRGRALRSGFLIDRGAPARRGTQTVRPKKGGGRCRPSPPPNGRLGANPAPVRSRPPDDKIKVAPSGSTVRQDVSTGQTLDRSRHGRGLAGRLRPNSRPKGAPHVSGYDRRSPPPTLSPKPGQGLSLGPPASMSVLSVQFRSPPSCRASRARPDAKSTPPADTDVRQRPFEGIGAHKARPARPRA